MNKSFLAASVALFALSAGAQSFEFLTFGTETPGLTEPGMMGMAISPNGRYVCGALEMGIGYFVGDLQTNTFIFDGAADEEGSDLRHIDNNGLAIGFDGPGVTISIDGTRTELTVPSSQYKYVLGEAITNDGSMLVGELVGAGYKTYAAIKKGNEEWQLLPDIDPDLLGVYANRGTAAKHCSGDGRVIAGYAGSFGPATLWVRNDNGEYEVDPIFTQYAKVTTTSPEPWAGFYIQGLSNNGKYVLLQGRANDNPERAVPMVYDTETRELKVYDEPQQGFEDGGFGITPTAICDNGMFVGVVGQVSINLGGFIMFPGETQAIMLADAYPEYSDNFFNMDVYNYHMPMCLSADGAYLIGYGYYSPDPFDDTIMPYFATYVLGTGYGSSVTNIEDAAKVNAVEYYSIDGTRRQTLGKGLNIVRTPDGKTRKIMK